MIKSVHPHAWLKTVFILKKQATIKKFNIEHLNLKYFSKYNIKLKNASILSMTHYEEFFPMFVLYN